MIPKILVIMAWIMKIGVQAESSFDPKGKVYPNGYLDRLSGSSISEKSSNVAEYLMLPRQGECRQKMGDCADSCPDFKIFKDPEIDGCTELAKVRTGCLITCPPCVREGLAKFQEIFQGCETCDKDQDCTKESASLCINGKCVDYFIIGNGNSLCANEAVIRNEKECEKAATLYGKDFRTIEIGDRKAMSWQGGCSILWGVDNDEVVFNYANYGFIQPKIKPICRRKETLEKKAKDEMFKEMIQTISTAKENEAQISVLRSKVNTLDDLGQYVSQGCWIRYPSGCPNQISRPQYNRLQNNLTWNRDNFRGASNSRQKCFARKQPLNNWCGVDDIIVQYV